MPYLCSLPALSASRSPVEREEGGREGGKNGEEGKRRVIEGRGERGAGKERGVKGEEGGEREVTLGGSDLTR